MQALLSAESSQRSQLLQAFNLLDKELNVLIEREVRIRLEAEYRPSERPKSPAKEPKRTIPAKPLLSLSELPLEEASLKEVQEEKKAAE